MRRKLSLLLLAQPLLDGIKMTVKTFAIKLLSNPSVPYYSPGQVAEGTLHIVNDQECTTKGKILGRKVCIRSVLKLIFIL